MSEKQGILMPAMYGGIIAGVASAIPFLNLLNCLCCAWILLGGFLGVFFYRKEMTEGSAPITNSLALQVGALSGLVAAVVGTVLSFIIISTVGNLAGEVMYDIVVSFYDSMGILDQMSQDQIDQLEGMKEGALSMWTVIGALVIDPLFGLLGGLIGYQVYKPKATPPPVMPAM